MKILISQIKVCLSVYLAISLSVMPIVSIAYFAPTGTSPRSTLASSAATDVCVIKNGSALTLKSNFGSQQEIIINCNANSSSNGAFNWVKTSIKTGSVTKDIVASNDDVTPLKINSQYAGGNHGYMCKWTVQTPVHNKTAADKGSVWRIKDKEFVLLAAGGTFMYFLAPYSVTDDIVSILSTSPSGTAVYVRGGSEGHNTDDIIISGGGVCNQMHSSINNISVKCYADDIELTANGTYYCERFEIKEQYNIMAYDKMFQYAETHSGVYANDAIDGVVRMENSYSYTRGLDCTVQSEVTALKKFNCTLYGALQGICMSNPTNGYIQRYMPNVKPKTATNPNTGATTQFDFAAGVNLTNFTTFFPSTSYALFYNTGDFNNPAIPPTHTVDWVCDSTGARQYGFAIGLLADVSSSSSNSERLQNCQDFWRMSATKKSYPNVMENTLFLPDESKTFIGFRNYLSVEDMPDATAVLSVKTTDAVYLYIDYNTAITDKSINLDEYIGRPVTILQSENFTLHNNIVDANGVTFDITSDIGNAVLKIDMNTPIVTAVQGSGCIVDNANKFIYGLEPGAASLESFIQVPTGYELFTAPSTIGTNTVVNATYDGVVVESYTLVLFGDTNGDGNIDSADASLVVDFENFMFEWDTVEDASFIKAADLNGDGNIDSSDASVIVDFENFKLNIDQTTGLAVAVL